jgi:hypothetical protein
MYSYCIPCYLFKRHIELGDWFHPRERPNIISRPSLQIPWPSPHTLSARIY